MRTDFFIAKRYLFAKKSHNVINIISIISLIGVMVGAMGLIIVLSVFNGFSNLVISLYDSFDPDIKITAVAGKTFDVDAIDLNNIRNTPGVANFSLTLEENALLKYRDRQFLATIKGVDSSFANVSGIQKKMIDGDYILERNVTNFAIAGSSIAYSLSLTLNDPMNQISVYVPKKGKPVSMLNPENAFNISLIRPAGVFSIQQDFDTKYVLVPLRFAREMTGNTNRVGAVEVKLLPGTDEESVRTKLASIAGNNFKVVTRIEQHSMLYKILKSEKWAVYFILSFILIIAVFNIVGSLTMLIIEKRKDVETLKALGADQSLIRSIFMIEGLMITLSGAITGMLLGAIICFIQQQFGIIKLENSESFVVDSYPVAMQVGDFLSVFFIIFLIGWVAAFYTSRKMIF